MLNFAFVKGKRAANAGEKESQRERERGRDCSSLLANRGSYGLWSVYSQLQHTDLLAV